MMIAVGTAMQTLFRQRSAAAPRMLRVLQGPRRQWWFAGGLAGAVTLHTARTTLDHALGALHPANEPPYGTNRLHDGPKAAAQALASWDRGSTEFVRFLRGRVDGRALARLHTLTECGYTLIVSGLLLALVGWVFNRLVDDAAEVGYLRRGILRWAGYLVPVYLVLGLLDQLLDWLLLRSTSFGTPATLSSGARLLARVLQGSSIARRMTLLAIVVPLIIGLLAVARLARSGHRFFATGSPYRVLIAVIALHAVILNAGAPGEQAVDAIRLWSHSLRLTVVAVLAVFWFSATVFVIGRRVGRSEQPPGPPQSEWRATARIAVAAAALAVVGFGLERVRHWGGGIGMLGLILGVVAVLNALLLVVVPRDPTIAESTAESIAETAAGNRDITAKIPIVSAATVAAASPTALPTALPAAPPDASTIPGSEPAELVWAQPAASPFLPSLLGFLPYVVLGRAVLRAAIPEAISPGGSVLLVPVCALILAIGSVLYVASRQPTFFAVGGDPTRFDPAFRAWLLGSFGLITLIAVWTWFHPWSIGRFLGVHGLLPAFLTGLTLAIGGLSYFTERWPVPGALRLIGIRRVPIVSTVLVWGFAASLLASDYHEVRTVEGPAPVGERTLTAEGAFTAWASHAVGDIEQPTDPTAAPALVAGRKPAVPMVFVAAAGGGIRAASFTAISLDCLLARIDTPACDDTLTLPSNWEHVFALSGASGGTVGIASTVAQLGSTGQADQWVARRLGGDLLSPSLAWQLFVEAPNAFLHLSPDMDRAEVIERSWERRWAGEATTGSTTGATPANPAVQPVLGAGASQWTGPLLLFNGTNVRDSCRVNISRLDGSDPADDSSMLTAAERDCRRQRLDETPPNRTTLAVNRDITDYLCADEDLRLSTAAFLSARFPFVSPTGDLRSAHDRGQTCPKADLPPLAIADGGYRDNTGASALIETWSQIAPLVERFNQTRDTCIVPVFIEIDNGHRNRNAAGEPGKLGQLLAPLSGALSVFGSRDAGWIEQAANEFSRELGPDVQVVDANGALVTDRFARLSLFAHPGVQAPLGWSLSPQAVTDITDQLTVPENAAAIAEVARWLTPGALSCNVT